MVVLNQGRIQDFKLGRTHLKQLRRAEGGAKILGVFHVKNHDFTPKNHIFSNYRGRALGAPPPPGSAPVNSYITSSFVEKCVCGGGGGVIKTTLNER
jgi:hypothetical protein